MSLEVNGQSYETDEEGYFANLNDWQPELADAMAAADGAELSDNHWEVINFLREYYEEYQIAPAVRVLTKAIGKKLGGRDHTTVIHSCEKIKAELKSNEELEEEITQVRLLLK